MSALLQVNDLHIRFGASHAVRGIEFQLNEGEVLGLVGESGSGKSATSLAIWVCLDRRHRSPAASCGVVQPTSTRPRASIFFARRRTVFADCAVVRSP